MPFTFSRDPHTVLDIEPNPMHPDELLLSIICGYPNASDLCVNVSLTREHVRQLIAALCVYEEPSEQGARPSWTQT